MTAADPVHRLLPPGALDEACSPGLSFLRRHGHEPAAEVLDLLLQTAEGCSYVRWVARRAWSGRAAEAIARGIDRAMELDLAGGLRDADFRRLTTGEVAGWIRAEIGGAQ